MPQASRRFCAIALTSLAAAAPSALAQLHGSADLVCTPAGPGMFNDTITLHNSGTTTIGTLWLGWVPGEDFLPSLPQGITAPFGWYAYVETGIYDSNSVQFYSSSPIYDLAPGADLAGFGFSSADDVPTLQSISTDFPRYHVTASYLYIGTPEADPGFLFTVGVTAGTAPPTCGSADFNCDGDVGTDSDIEAFFACLAGSCPAAPCTSTADFNGDGDTGTDADIEAFFRVLAGGTC